MKKFRTYDMALDFYKHCQKRTVTQSIIKDQLARASLSIVLNIAEGSGKMTNPDRKRFYAIAMGSLRETQAILQILDVEALTIQSDKLAAHLYCLMRNPGAPAKAPPLPPSLASASSLLPPARINVCAYEIAPAPQALSALQFQRSCVA